VGGSERNSSSSSTIHSMSRSTSDVLKRGLSTAVEAQVKPRVVFSGIQPTGIPHVRSTLLSSLSLSFLL